MATGGSSSVLRKVLKNVAIIGVGSAALIWWERRQNAVPRKVRDLAYEAAEIQREGVQRLERELGSSNTKGSTTLSPSVSSEQRVVPADNTNRLARYKWKQALDLSTENNLSPKVLFNLTFALACNLYDGGHVHDAEQQFKNALAAFPEGLDIHSLEENTRARVGIALDRLAQMEQDRGRFAAAMVLYDRALDALATPEETSTMATSLLERPVHVEALAGVLNNVAMLYLELGKEEAAKKVLERSDALMDARKMTKVVVESADHAATAETTMT